MELCCSNVKGNFSNAIFTSQLSAAVERETVFSICGFQISSNSLSSELDYAS